MAILGLSAVAGKVNTLRKMLLYGARHSSESYIRKLNRLGASIDQSVHMAAPETVWIDMTMPYLLQMGKNVMLAAHVTILTHDAGWLVMKANDGVVRGHAAPVKIGNNVFIGMYSVILCNVTICDNVIIAANSVVTSSIKEPGVYAGNPAKLVAPYDRYLAIRDSRQVQEAYKVARMYYDRFGEKPPQEIFYEYFWIFYPRSEIDKMPECFRAQLATTGNGEQSLRKFKETEPDFESYEAFWDWCSKKITKERERYERQH